MKKMCLTLTLLMVISACKVEREVNSKMLSNNDEMKVYCAGRHLIDLPSSFSPSPITTGMFKGVGLSAQDPFIEITVRAAELMQPKFELQVMNRRNELKNKGDDTADVLRLEKKLNDQATLFRVQRIDDAYISEINLWRGSSIVTASLASYRNQFLAAEESLIKFTAGIKEKDKKISEAQLSGFCLGPVIISGEFMGESAGFHFGRDQEKGVGFDISLDTYAKDEGITLLARVSGPDSLLNKFNVRHKVLRARELTVAGMRAMEWLGWADLGEQEEERSLKFVLETMRPIPGKAAPSIHLSFATGQPLEDGSVAKTALSDEEAVQLWDSVVKSIRPASG